MTERRDVGCPMRNETATHGATVRLEGKVAALDVRPEVRNSPDCGKDLPLGGGVDRPRSPQGSALKRNGPLGVIVDLAEDSSFSFRAPVALDIERSRVIRLCQDSIVNYATDERLKSRLARRSPIETAVIGVQSVEGASCLSVAVHKPHVIAC